MADSLASSSSSSVASTEQTRSKPAAAFSNQQKSSSGEVAVGIERSQSGFKKLLGSKLKSKKEKGVQIGTPTNFEQRSHVSLNFEWSENPEEAFQLQEQLGEGAYGTVYKATHKESGFVAAVKIIPQVQSASAQEEMKKEINILKKCSHDCIVQYYGCCATNDSLWILMDYCGFGAVQQILKARKPRALEENEIAVIMFNVVRGLAYLHENNVIHRDIKSGNILINEQGIAKIADFGVSAQIGGALSTAQTVIGTPLFMAPEVLSGEIYDSRADIWSLGITAIEFAEGVPPYFEEHFMRAMCLIATEDPPTLKDKSKWSEDFKSFLATCLKKEPDERPAAKDLLKHPFLLKSLTLNAKEIMTHLTFGHSEDEDDSKSSSFESSLEQPVQGGLTRKHSYESDEDDVDKPKKGSTVEGNKPSLENLKAGQVLKGSVIVGRKTAGGAPAISVQALVDSDKLGKKKSKVEKKRRKTTLNRLSPRESDDTAQLRKQLQEEKKKNKRAEKTIKELRNQLSTEQKVDKTMIKEVLKEIAVWKQRTEELEAKLQSVLNKT